MTNAIICLKTSLTLCRSWLALPHDEHIRRGISIQRICLFFELEPSNLDHMYIFAYLFKLTFVGLCHDLLTYFLFLKVLLCNYISTRFESGSCRIQKLDQKANFEHFVTVLEVTVSVWNSGERYRAIMALLFSIK